VHASGDDCPGMVPEHHPFDSPVPLRLWVTKGLGVRAGLIEQATFRERQVELDVAIAQPTQVRVTMGVRPEGESFTSHLSQLRPRTRPKVLPRQRARSDPVHEAGRDEERARQSSRLQLRPNSLRKVRERVVESYRHPWPRVFHQLRQRSDGNELRQPIQVTPKVLNGRIDHSTGTLTDQVITEHHSPGRWNGNEALRSAERLQHTSLGFQTVPSRACRQDVTEANMNKNGSTTTR
jgi:hypothetical protein